MKLSICMMVKNEEINLERCLSSLNKLRDTIENELIIIDTGSTDRTVEIARKFTDKVFFYDWNNNFSEMRNTSISFAKGEWILIIDADEELIDDTDIIQFMSESNKTYNSATFFLENIVSQNGKRSAVATTLRLFRNTKYFHYTGAIHNLPIYELPTKHLTSLILHYGYMSDDEVLMQKKFERTSRLLINELNKDPNNIYYRYQLGTTYDMYKKPELALEQFEMAYSLIKTKDNNLNDFIYLFGAYGKVLMDFKAYHKVIEIAEEILKVEKQHLDLIYYSGMSFLFIGKLQEGINRLEEFLDLMANYKNLEISKRTDLQLYTLNSHNECLLNLSSAYIKVENWNKVAETAQELLVMTDSSSDFYMPLVSNYFLALLYIERYSEIIDFYNNLDENLYGHLDDVLITLIYENISQFYSPLLIEALSDLEGNFGKLLKSVILQNPLKDFNVDFIKQSLRKNCFTTMYYLIQNNELFSNELAELCEEGFVSHVNHLVNHHEDFVDYIRDINLKFDKEDSFSVRELKRRWLKVLFLLNINKEGENSLFADYMTYAESYLLDKYNINYINISNLYGFKTSEEQFFACAYLAKENTKDSNMAMVNAMNIFPEWNNSLIRWLDEIFNHINEENENLKRQLLREVLKLENLGLVQDAIDIIDVYLSMYPGDVEMLSYKSNLLVKSTKN